MTILRLHPILFAIFLVLAALGIGTALTRLSESKGAADGKAPAIDGHTVELVVTSSDSRTGSVSYVTLGSDPPGFTEQPDVRLPWRKVFQDVDPPRSVFTLVAQQSGGGRLRCVVKVDGEVVAEDTARGEFSVVRCRAG